MIYTMGELTACIKEYCQKFADLMSADESLQQGIDSLQDQIDSFQVTSTNTQIYTEKFAGGDNGVNGSAIWSRNSTVTRTAEGRYTVVFNSPHVDGDEYHVSLSGSEDINNRDNPKVTLVYPTKTANGFDVMVTVDDNGGGADTFEDNGWSFGVDCPVSVVTDVQASTS